MLKQVDMKMSNILKIHLSSITQNQVSKYQILSILNNILKTSNITKTSRIKNKIKEKR